MNIVTTAVIIVKFGKARKARTSRWMPRITSQGSIRATRTVMVATTAAITGDIRAATAGKKRKCTIITITLAATTRDNSKEITISIDQAGTRSLEST